VWGEYYGDIGSATVIDTAGNFADDDIESVLAYLADNVGGGTTTTTTSSETSDIIVSVSDITDVGTTSWQYEIQSWADSGGVYYGKVFDRGSIRLTMDEGLDFTPYINYLPGATFGSERGVRINLRSGDTFSDERIVRFFSLLDDAGGVDISALSRAKDSKTGISTPVLIPTNRLFTTNKIMRWR